jgi:hypothetical protein
MNAITNAPVEMPRDALKALDRLLDYAAYDEMRHYAECVSDGGSSDDHVWVAIRRLLEWRAGLPGTSIYRARDLLTAATEWEQAAAEDETA